MRYVYTAVLPTHPLAIDLSYVWCMKWGESFCWNQGWVFGCTIDLCIELLTENKSMGCTLCRYSSNLMSLPTNGGVRLVFIIMEFLNLSWILTAILLLWLLYRCHITRKLGQSEGRFTIQCIKWLQWPFNLMDTKPKCWFFILTIPWLELQMEFY